MCVSVKRHVFILNFIYTVFNFTLLFQGTVTPTHMVVTDENYPENEPELSADIIQQLAYKLTHMYFNWPGTVRVPGMFIVKGQKIFKGKDQIILATGKG